MKKTVSIVFKGLIFLVVFLGTVLGLSQIFIEPKKEEWALWQDAPEAMRSQCAWIDNYTIHPFLGMTLKSTGPCTITFVNKQGFHSEENFDELKADQYNILLLGGSVALQLYSLRTDPDQQIELNKCLNRKFKHPTKNKIVVSNATVPSSGQPYQLITWILYGRHFDALVSVEGYNELGNYNGRLNSLESFIITNYIQMALSLGKGTSFQKKFVTYWKSFFKSIEGLKNSHFGVKIYSELVRWYYNPTSDISLITQNYRDEIRLNDQNNFNLDEFLIKYQDRLFNLDLMLKGVQKPYFVALQPIPSVERNLTKDEINFFEPMTVEPYEKIDKMFQKNSSKIPLIRYRDLFKPTPETVYIDYIHTNNFGTQIFVDRLCEDIGSRFKLQKRN